ncbi:YoaK family protein [Tundrisphaera lichenicola]|uniref:YoaK family protein n=1 Tax=Tundrisphaera lichenicola TaxID=2029860 RepID=UPI003EB8FDD4
MWTDNPFKDVIAQRNQPLWLILAFQSGFMNAGGFLACGRFVSHVTGYGTYVGVAFAQRNYLNAVEMGLAPLFFLAGAAYSGWLIDRRLMLGQRPRLLTGVVWLALLNLIICVGEDLGFFGTFGEPLLLQRDFALLFLLSFACGLQNGLFVGVTDGKIRTTHLTGPTTDMGINLAKIFTYRRDDPERGQLSALNWLKTKIAIAFSSGSMIATLVFSMMTYQGFAVPFVTSLGLIWYVHRLLKIGEGEPRQGQPLSVLIPVEPPGGSGTA